MNLTSNYIERIKFNESQNLDLPEGCKIHFIGIGGSSMSGLAEIVLKRGYKVSGSDKTSSINIERLKKLGANIYIGHNTLNVPDDCYLVVYTLAISSDNPEYLAALSNNIPVIERGHFLGILTKEHKYSVCVSGTHGKTTTTSMIASVMLSANLDPSIHIGGNLPIIGGNVRSSKSQYFVTEACEYHENFLNLSPYAGVILNIEAEHLDYFKDIDAICNAFKKFINLIPEEGFAVVCAESEYALKAAKEAKCNVLTYGFSHDCDFQAKDIVLERNHTAFTLYISGERKVEISLKIPGKHNILNALATIAVCYNLGCDIESIKEGLSVFSSPDRRFQTRGYCNGAPVIDDYAHHPTEINVTVASAKQITEGKIYCVFQPHTYSRAKAFGDDFAEALKDCDVVIVADIYAAREKNPGDISAMTLVDKFLSKDINALYISNFSDIAEYILKEVNKKDTVLLLGAGNINGVASLLINQ